MRRPAIAPGGSRDRTCRPPRRPQAWRCTRGHPSPFGGSGSPLAAPRRWRARCGRGSARPTPRSAVRTVPSVATPSSATMTVRSVRSTRGRPPRSSALRPAAEPHVGFAVHPQHVVVELAHDEERRRCHVWECIPGQVGQHQCSLRSGPSAARTSAPAGGLPLPRSGAGERGPGRRKRCGDRLPRVR